MIHFTWPLRAYPAGRSYHSRRRRANMEYAKRLLVADTSDEFRRHLIEALQNESDMEVVGETGDGQQLLEMVRTLQPDAVVMEMVLSGMDGIEVLEQLRELPPEHRPRIPGFWCCPATSTGPSPTWPPPMGPTTSWSSPANSAPSAPASGSSPLLTPWRRTRAAPTVWRPWSPPLSMRWASPPISRATSISGRPSSSPWTTWRSSTR